jgi:hypothetical protein
MSRNQLIIGLANQALANTIWDSMQNLSGSTGALTVGASTASLGFFGTTPATQPVVPNTSNTTTIANALLALGLVKSA